MLEIKSSAIKIQLKATKEDRTLEVQIAVPGKFDHPAYGKFELTTEIFEKWIENWKNDPTDIVVDYNHGAYSEDPEAAKAAGWVKELWIAEDGSLWGLLEFTPKGWEYVKNKEYRYISPTFTTEGSTDNKGNDIGPKLYTVSITNVPFLDMEPLAAKQKLEKTEGVNEMKTKLERILKLSGASEERLLEVVEDTVKKAEKSETEILSLKDANKKLSDELTEIKKKLLEKETEVMTVKANEAVEKLVREAKIIPAQKDAYIELYLRDQEMFEKLTKDLQPNKVLTSVHGDSTPDEGKTATQKVIELTDKYQKELKMSASQALGMVKKEHPDLYAEYRKENTIE